MTSLARPVADATLCEPGLASLTTLEVSREGLGQGTASSEKRPMQAGQTADRLIAWIKYHRR
jgi:hypothetical protein